MKQWSLCVFVTQQSAVFCLRQWPLWLLSALISFESSSETSFVCTVVRSANTCFKVVFFCCFQMSMAAGQEMSGHHQPSNTKKRRRWGGLRQQWKLLGLFEIDQQHEFYALTCMIKEGLAAVTQNTDDNAPTVSIAQPFRKQHIWGGGDYMNKSVCHSRTRHNLIYLLPVVPLGNVSLFHIDGLRWLSEAT